MTTDALVRTRFGAERLCGRGISNAKFRDDERLVRVNENVSPATGLARFEKAAFCAEICGRLGVPVAAVMEVGTLPNGRPYSVERWVDGLPADLVRDEGQRVRIWEAVGAAIAPVHAADLGGREAHLALGYDGDGPTTRWEDHLVRVIGTLEGDDTLGLSPTERARLADGLRGLDVGRYPPGLTHGDLKLDNVLVDPDTLAIRAILDWELARFVPAALGEYATSVEPAVLPSKEFAVARSPAERAAFLRGLGQPEDRAFQLFFAADVLTNVGWYAVALRSDRPDVEVLHRRLANYLAGVRDDLAAAVG